VVVTGGDDQHLCASLFEASTDSESLTLVGAETKYAHSSCIKGVVVTKGAQDRSEDGFSVHSSGYDQRYKKWHLKICRGEDGLDLQKIDSVRHGLSDMNGMCKSAQSVYLVGQGIQAFN